jgi:thioredoxin reductase (NADPH)
MEETHMYDVIIIGAGPAGLTAAIYAARGGLNALIIEKGIAGGLVNEAPLIENYPGFKSVNGMELMDQMKAHASKYVNIHEGEIVEAIEFEDRIGVTTGKDTYDTEALVIATGTTHRKLGVTGEEEFSGRGVSYCATCDGFFFKGKKVIVSGGGNTAVIDAIYLGKIGCDVKLIHRRDALRAEASLQKQLFDAGVDVIWNSVIEEIGGENLVERVQINDKKNGSSYLLDVDGVFVSIGEDPNTKLAAEIGVELDRTGYILTDKKQRTNISGIYAAGDVTGGVKQIVVACAEGATAALTAHEDLKKPYWSGDSQP